MSDLSPETTAVELGRLRTRVAELERQLSSHQQLEERLSQSEQQWRSLVHNAPDIIVTLDQQARIQFINHTPPGYTIEEVIGSAVYQYVLPSQREQVKEKVLRVFQTARPDYYEVQDIRNLGWYAARMAPVMHEGNVVSVVAIFTDFTERKHVEEALTKARDELEQRVVQRTEELGKANQQLRHDIAMREKIEPELRLSEESLRSERQLLKRLLDLHERERQLIAYEIHDGIVQDMTGALMFLEASNYLLSSDTATAKSDMSNGMRILRESIKEARRLINGLRPAILDEQGVIAAVENLIEEVAGSNDITIEFVHRTTFDRVAPTLERAIYRIVQEGLNNIVRHSRSGRAKVEMVQRGERIDMTIEDWGIGFDTSKVKKKRYGLTGVRERTRLLGGHARIHSTPGEGTRIDVDLPLRDVLLPAFGPHEWVNGEKEG